MHCPSRAIAWRCGMKSHSRFVIRFTLAMVALFAFGNMVPSAAGATFRWDTISLTFPGGVPTVNTGGAGYAFAADLTTIQISGHRTFGGGLSPTRGGTLGASCPSAGASGPANGTCWGDGALRVSVDP